MVPTASVHAVLDDLRPVLRLVLISGGRLRFYNRLMWL